MSGNVYFISGHLDLTQQEFNDHYMEHVIKAAREMDSEFVIGDAIGCDRFSQIMLATLGYRNRFTVYHMFDKPRNCEHSVKIIGGFKRDKERDEAMTNASTHDIAWIRPGREKSGTAKNLERRNEVKK